MAQPPPPPPPPHQLDIMVVSATVGDTISLRGGCRGHWACSASGSHSHNSAVTGFSDS